MISKFSLAYKDMLEGKYLNFTSEELIGGSRIVYVFNEIFRKTVQKTNPFDILSDDVIPHCVIIIGHPDSHQECQRYSSEFVRAWGCLRDPSAATNRKVATPQFGVLTLGLRGVETRTQPNIHPGGGEIRQPQQPTLWCPWVVAPTISQLNRPTNTKHHRHWVGVHQHIASWFRLRNGPDSEGRPPPTTTRIAVEATTTAATTIAILGSRTAASCKWSWAT